MDTADNQETRWMDIRDRSDIYPILPLGNLALSRMIDFDDSFSLDRYNMDILEAKFRCIHNL
jgi:hypothetical protein